MTANNIPTGKDRPLTAEIEGEEIVIRIGIDTLAFAAERCPAFYRHEKDEKATVESPYNVYTKVVDKPELAHDVIGALLHEEEDGSTPLCYLFDKAIEAARDDGSLAFADDEDDL